MVRSHGRGWALTACWLVAACLGFLAAATTPAAGAAEPGPVAFLAPAADATVDAARPRTALGARRTLSVARRPPARGYLRFRIPEGRVAAAHLRLFALDAAPRGYRVHAVAPGSWSESALTYRSAPRVMGAIGLSGPVARRSWTSVPVTGAVQAGRELTLALTARSRRALRLASREARSASLRPQLLVLFEPPPALPVFQPPPLVVQAPPPPVDRPPACEAALHRIQEDGELQGSIPCSDQEGGVSWKVVREPALGGVKLGPEGEFTYRPKPDRSGADGFAVEATDGAGQSATAEVTVEVTAVDDPPVAIGDRGAVAQDGVAALEPLANDAAGPADEQGQELRLAGVTRPPSYGSAQVTASGARIRYRPPAGYSGPDWFDYEVCDAAPAPGRCSTARVSVLVSPVSAARETDPVPNSGSAADDAAIWVNRADPAASTVIATDKGGASGVGGLAVYDLSGNELQYLPGGRMNNVDLRQDFPLGAGTVALVTVGDRLTDEVAIFSVDPATGLLEDIGAPSLKVAADVEGLCMYRSPVTGAHYVFATSEAGVAQWELLDDGAGHVDAELVDRDFEISPKAEGCVADDERGDLYVGDEAVGILSFDAEPGGASSGALVDGTGPNGQLTADLEGLTLTYGPDGGHLIAVSRGSHEYVVYGRGAGNPHLRTVRIVAGGEIDKTERIEGIDATASGLGPPFDSGLFVTQDGDNAPDNQNFKLVPLDAVVGTSLPADVPPRPDGCFRPYSPDGPWNTPIGASPTYHSDSEFHVGAMQGELSSDPNQYTYPVYEVDAATRRSSVTLSGWFSNVVAPDTLINDQDAIASLPLPDGAEPAAGDDAQVVLIDRKTGDEWGASRLQRDITGQWSAWNAYHYNTGWSGVPPRDAKGKPFFLRGAGVPYLAGLVRPCELARGRIEHALAFAYDSPTPSYVYPATKSDGIGTDPADMPEGARLQLDPSLEREEIEAWGCTGPCLTIARALQEYGMYIIDNSGRPKVMLEYEGTAQWNGVVGEGTVSPIPLDAFKLLDHPPPSDQPPVAAADSATVLEDAAPQVIDVLANDTDGDGGPKSIASRTQPANGTVHISDDGLAVTYEPDPDYCNDPPGTSTDDFRYTLAPGSSSATVKVRVTCVNDAPVANDDTATTANDTTLNVSAPGVLANDTDPDPGDTGTVTKLNDSTTLTGTSVEGGAVTIDADGSYSYIPPIKFQSLAPGASVTDSFDYTMADEADSESTATVNITITGPAPTAGDDSFAATGNTGLFVGTTPPAGQAGKRISGTLLQNDTDPDTPQSELVATPVTAQATALGGSVTIEPDGNFTYLPPAGGSASDSFTYTVSDGIAFDTGTVTITRANEVWYVRNDAAPAGTGRSNDPFDTIAEAEAASGTGDDIYVFDGDGTTAGLTTGFDLEGGQRLLGEAVDLKVGADMLFAGNAAKRPTLTDSNADVVALASGATVSGLELDPSGAGGGIAGVGAGVSGSTIRDVRVIDDDGSAGTQPGLELDRTLGSHSISDLTVANAATGVRLNDAGTVVFAPAGTISITSAGAKGLDAAATSMGSGSEFDQIVVTGSPDGGVKMANMSGTTTLGDGVGVDLSLTTTSGAIAALLLDSAGSVSVPAAGTANISATGGPAVDVTRTAGAMLRLDDVVSMNSAGDGINLAGLEAGTFSATSGEIAGASGIAFDLEGGKGDIDYAGALKDGAGQTAEITGRLGAEVTLSGDITDGADLGGGIVVTGNNAGSTVFSGSTKTLNTGAHTAVEVSSKVGHGVAFTGGRLDIDTTSGTGLSATGPGPGTGGLAVTGLGNTISSGTGRALSVTNTNIGFPGFSEFRFESISANGGANGIVLENTGPIAGLTVTGTAVADSGGIIENQTGPAIRALNTTKLSLSRMRVQGGQDDGVHVLQGGSAAMAVNVTGSTFSNNRGDHFEAVTTANATGALNITFSGNKLATTTTAIGGGIAINPANGGQVTANVQGNDIQGAVGSAIAYELDAPTSGLLKGTISGNTIGQPGVPGSGSLQGEGISVTGNGNGTVTVAMLNNAIRQWSSGSGIGIVQGSGDGTMNATVRRNTISNPGMTAANGIRAEAGTIPGDRGTLCADVGGTGDDRNSATGSGANLSTDLRVGHNFETRVQLPGYVGSATDTVAVGNYLTARNGGASAIATVNTTAPFGEQYLPVASCLAPAP